MENSTLSFAMKHTGQLELNFQIETKATLRKYMMLNISKATNAFIWLQPLVCMGNPQRLKHPKKMRYFALWTTLNFTEKSFSELISHTQLSMDF